MRRLRDRALAKRSVNAFVKELETTLDAGDEASMAAAVGNAAAHATSAGAQQQQQGEEGRAYVVRNNILLVLGDLCRRFTGLVDRYVPRMAACLRGT